MRASILRWTTSRTMLSSPLARSSRQCRAPARCPPLLANHRAVLQQTSNVVGLLRFEMTGNTLSDRSRSSAPKYDAIAEVERLGFRYFDGKQWQAAWNSDARGGQLPAGVEIQVQTGKVASALRYVIDLPTVDSKSKASVQQRVMEAIQSRMSGSEQREER